MPAWLDLLELAGLLDRSRAPCASARRLSTKAVHTSGVGVGGVLYFLAG